MLHKKSASTRLVTSCRLSQLSFSIQTWYDKHLAIDTLMNYSTFPTHLQFFPQETGETVKVLHLKLTLYRCNNTVPLYHMTKFVLHHTLSKHWCVLLLCFHFNYYYRHIFLIKSLTCVPFPIQSQHHWREKKSLVFFKAQAEVQQNQT